MFAFCDCLRKLVVNIFLHCRWPFNFVFDTLHLLTFLSGTTSLTVPGLEVQTCLLLQLVSFSELYNDSVIAE